MAPPLLDNPTLTPIVRRFAEESSAQRDFLRLRSEAREDARHSRSARRSLR
jgi:hypothetical protein